MESMFHLYALHGRSPLGLALAAGVFGLALAGCGSGKDKRAGYAPEAFDSTDTHARTFAASEAQTCEAARRALLSQGYQIKDASNQLVTGSKSFQPDNEVHMEMQLRVVCAKDSGLPQDRHGSIAFVSALQDRYSLKRVNNSASVGVGVLGSLSLPYSSSEDAMVKVASQTVTDEQFYERFYTLIERYLQAQGPEPAPPSAAGGKKD
jgi:hypothetical protein